MKKFLFLLFICAPFFGNTQMKKGALEKIAATITADDLKKHLYIVASAEMEGRDTPSPGLEKAAVYIEEHFKSLGLKPGNGESYRQYYPLYQDVLNITSIIVNGVSFEMNKDFLAGNNYAASMSFSQIVFGGYGIVDESLNSYKDLDIRGKAVIILEGAPTSFKSTKQGFQNPASNMNKINAAAAKGAAAVLVVSKNLTRRVGSASWVLNKYKTSFAPINFTISEKIAVALMGQDGSGIFDKLKNESLVAKNYNANIDLIISKTTNTTSVSNVLGLIEGTDKKDEYVIITAHYDHVGKRNDTTIFYGADDDGSGTVSILELAQAFAKAKAEGNGPRRSILFMTVSGEEHGLWGSEYYSNNPIYPIEKTSVDLNIDMVGRIGEEYLKDKDSTNYVYVIGDNKLSSDLTPITDMANKRRKSTITINNKK